MTSPWYDSMISDDSKDSGQVGSSYEVISATDASVRGALGHRSTSLSGSGGTSVPAMLTRKGEELVSSTSRAGAPAHPVHQEPTMTIA